jgi:NADH-quinone oxidoreductase subunit J
MDTLLFYIFAVVAVASALSVVLTRRVFYAAISLIVCLASLSGVYMVLESPFIAAVQVIVYAGAIMVLFLFVIMLLDPFSAAVLQDKRKSLTAFAPVIGIIVLVLLYPVLRSVDLSKPPAAGADFGTVRAIGEALFRDFLLPFEVTSILILVAIIGAVVLAKRQG